jgi:hypothetical protein
VYAKACNPRGSAEILGTVHRTAASSSGFGAHNSQDAQVVLQSGYAGAGSVANHLADVVDLSISLGAFAEHEIGILSTRDVSGTKRKRHHLELDTEGLDALSQLRQTFHRPLLIKTLGWKSAANIIHAKRR